jgi:uncharacterized protein YcbK (DUF882 family)
MKMTERDWQRVRHFSSNEKWGDPLEMDRELIFLLDALRDLCHSRFIIHCGYERAGHTEKSQHYLGRAVDFHIEQTSFRDAVDLIVELVGPPPRGLGVGNRIGLGIYPHWANPGFHLDTRGTFARWGAVTRGGSQVYVSWNEAIEVIG